VKQEVIGRVLSIELENVAVKRGGQVVLDLRGSRLRLEKGRVYVLAGPNGAGKTTMLDLIAGMLRPFTGRVVVNDGIDLYGFGAGERSLIRRKHYSYLLQDCILFDGFTVWDNMLLPSRLAGHAPSQEWTDRVVETLRLHALLKRRPGQLSGGEYRRACLAGSLLKAEAASVVLLDEPTISIERAMIPGINSLVRELARDRILIVATHDPLVAEAGDETISLRAGKLESNQ